PHPLLAQLPLTVSPFLSLPTSVPLPYSYKTLPSTLPPSITTPAPTNTNPNLNSNASDPHAPAPPHANQQQPPQSAAYIYPPSGTGPPATPDSILTSCTALQAHLQALEADARRTLKSWEEQRAAADLAEKRRLAPGWLDSGVHILRPENVGEGEGVGGGEDRGRDGDVVMQGESREGEELDRVFGGLKV
ncbi:hypothetical protein IQ07DRAFT_524785, partial [Pyrenochaeta sp. DS3sAY3a]